MSPEKACPSQIVNRPTRPLRSDDLRVGISPAQTIQTGRVRPLEPGEGALTEEQVEHCLDVAPIAAVGPAGVGIVVESSTSCGQTLSILLRHRCRVLLQHRVVCCAHQQGFAAGCN